MKKVLLAGLALLSMNAFSQSYLVLSNGVVLTTGSDGVVYDLHNFILPSKISSNGGQFLIEDDEVVTFYGNGYLFRPEIRVGKDIKLKGMNYFFKGSDLFTVSESGFVTRLKDKDSLFRRVEKLGGNFFVTNVDERRKVADLVTVNSKGFYSHLTVVGLNPFTISAVGGTYFSAAGVVYTVSKDGFVYPKPELKTGVIKLMGGNFFISEVDGGLKLFTVAEDGILNRPSLPVSFNAKSVRRAGANYMIDTDGRIFTVSSNGSVAEGNAHKHDLRSIKFLSFR